MQIRHPSTAFCEMLRKWREIIYAQPQGKLSRLGYQSYLFHYVFTKSI
jgi:hypothetical protein